MTARVVIADDDVDIRALVRISATRAGFEIVAEVGDGDAALAAVREFAPDLAILDVTMPGLTGVEVCRAVREDPALDAVRILLLSAAVGEVSMATGLEAGAAAYFEKPFSPRELTASLIGVLGGAPS
ncbi:MAG TPA: response regulator [Galbitalea sp.]|jgi:DNA-binding response OmpR family regulator